MYDVISTANMSLNPFYKPPGIAYRLKPPSVCLRAKANRSSSPSSSSKPPTGLSTSEASFGSNGLSPALALGSRPFYFDFMSFIYLPTASLNFLVFALCASNLFAVFTTFFSSFPSVFACSLFFA